MPAVKAAPPPAYPLSAARQALRQAELESMQSMCCVPCAIIRKIRQRQHVGFNLVIDGSLKSILQISIVWDMRVRMLCCKEHEPEHGELAKI